MVVPTPLACIESLEPPFRAEKNVSKWIIRLILEGNGSLINRLSWSDPTHGPQP
jgi:hypothetical protein